MSKLPEVTAWSYSRYGLYKQCPAKFAYKHLHKLPDPSGPAAERGNLIHKMAEDFVSIGGTTVPPQLKNVSSELLHLRDAGATVEQEWGFNRNWEWTGRKGWFGADVWVRIKADAVTLYDDGTALAVDWKTGKRYDDHAEQAELTAILTMARYKEIEEVDVRFLYVDEPAATNELQITFSRASLPKMHKDWEKKVQPMFKDRKFPPKANRFCNWCTFSRSKGGPCKF